MAKKIKGKYVTANTIDDTHIRLRNLQFLRARNAADNGDLDLIRVTAANEFTLGRVLHCNNFNIRDVGTPSAGTEAANKDYVDLEIQKRAWKQPVRVATTANLGALSGLLTVDGVTLNSGDRVLVKDQTVGADNGIYTAASGAWTRATDFDTSAKVPSGILVCVTEGTASDNQTYRLTTNDPITLGTTALAFSSSSAVLNSFTHSFMPDQVEAFGTTPATRNGWRSIAMATTGVNGVTMQTRLEGYTPGNPITLAAKFSSDLIGVGNVRLQSDFFLPADGAANNIAATTFTDTITPGIAVLEAVINFSRTFTAASLGSPAAGNVLRIDFFRDGSNAADTYTSTIRWLTGMIKW